MELKIWCNFWGWNFVHAQNYLMRGPFTPGWCAVALSLTPHPGVNWVVIACRKSKISAAPAHTFVA